MRRVYFTLVKDCLTLKLFCYTFYLINKSIVKYLWVVDKHTGNVFYAVTAKTRKQNNEDTFHLCPFEI